MPTNNIPSLQSGPVQRGNGPYGQVPTVPNPFGTQGGAITGNMGNLSNLYGLTNSLNTNIAQQAQLPFNLNLPNYQGMTNQSSQNNTALLKGQVPQDVLNQIAQTAAERGISTGSMGSPNSNAAMLRALGLTSLGLQQQGEQNLTGAMARTPTGQQFNPQQFLVTPQQNQEAQYFANLLGAAPNPGAGQQASLNALRSGMGSIGSLGNYGARGGTDLLGFSTGNMSPYQNFGGMDGQAFGNPNATGYVNTSSSYNPWAGSSSTISRSGGDFGSVNPGAGFGTSNNFSGLPATGDPWPGYNGSVWPDNQFGMGWGDVGGDLYP